MSSPISGIHDIAKVVLQNELANFHIKDGIIRILHYHTTHDKLPTIEKVLREEFNLVNADGFKDKKLFEEIGIVPHGTVLVYEVNGQGSGLYRVHFYNKYKGESIVRFDYWDTFRDGVNIPEKFYKQDPMRKALERIYWEIKPYRVSGTVLDVEVDVPWDKKVREEVA